MQDYTDEFYGSDTDENDWDGDTTDEFSEPGPDLSTPPGPGVAKALALYRDMHPLMGTEQWDAPEGEKAWNRYHTEFEKLSASDRAHLEQAESAYNVEQSRPWVDSEMARLAPKPRPLANPFTLQAARLKAELPQAEAELSKLGSASDPGKRMEVATRVGQLRKGIEESEMRAPFYGLDDAALIGTLENAEIAAEETTDRLKGLPEKSVRAQRARREQEQAMRQVALARGEQRYRKQLLATEYGQAEQTKRDLRNAWSLERAARVKDLEEQRRELLSKPRSTDGTLALATIVAQIDHLRSADPDPEWAKRWKRERASK